MHSCLCVPQYPHFYHLSAHSTLFCIYISASWRIKRTRKKSSRDVTIYSSCFFFQLVKVREKVKDVPALLAKFDELNKKLHINGQVTVYTLDALLCHTPSDRQPHTVLLNKRTVSRRTFQPLSQSLWAE